MRADAPGTRRLPGAPVRRRSEPKKHFMTLPPHRSEPAPHHRPPARRWTSAAAQVKINHWLMGGRHGQVARHRVPGPGRGGRRFRAAARELDVSPPAVTKLIAALERDLGTAPPTGFAAGQPDPGRRAVPPGLCGRACGPARRGGAPLGEPDARFGGAHRRHCVIVARPVLRRFSRSSWAAIRR